MGKIGKIGKIGSVELTETLERLKHELNLNDVFLRSRWEFDSTPGHHP